MKSFMLVAFLILISFTFGQDIQCRDEQNNPVDWYVLYKIPHQKKHAQNKIIKAGDAYLYISSSNVTKWQLSTLSINNTESFLHQTLVPLYDETQNFKLLHVLYNDEPPNKNSNLKKGHTKGIIVGNENGGIWIVHSVPLYPPPFTNQYKYPLTGTVYGQSILCMSLDQQNLDWVGIQLKYNQPEIYSTNLPEELKPKYPIMQKVIERDVILDPPYFHTLGLKSKGGAQFMSFAKTKNFKKDLYLDWVAPALKTNLLVQTWLNGPGKLPSNCSTVYKVHNVESIKLDAAKFTYKAALDHSKWAVANSTDSNWICIGDINRAEHQELRGGGTVCFNNKIVAEEYRSSVYAIEKCKNE